MTEENFSDRTEIPLRGFEPLILRSLVRMLWPCDDYLCCGGMVVLHSKVVVAVAKQVCIFRL